MTAMDWSQCAAVESVSGKVSGAGGGGFVMLVADPLRRVAVVRALEKLPGQVIPCHFTHEGVQTWTVGE